jgi:hypothetical protein
MQASFFTAFEERFPYDLIAEYNRTGAAVAWRLLGRGKPDQ